MIIDKKKLDELNNQYSKLKKDEKIIISISDVKKRIDEIIDLTEKLEEMLSEQMNALEVVNECDDDSCSCDNEVEQSELYKLYSELEDRVLSKDFYRALRIIS